MSYLTLEIFIYFLIVIWLLYHTNVIRQFAGIERYKLILIWVLIFMAILGQGLKDNKLTYPFSYWGMYSSPYTSNSFLEYNITLKDGTSLHYPFDEVTYFSRRAFMRKIDDKHRAATSTSASDTTAKHEVRENLDDMLRALSAIYETNHPGTEIIKFEIDEVRIPIHNWEGKKSLTRNNTYSFRLNETD